MNTTDGMIDQKLIDKNFVDPEKGKTADENDTTNLTTQNMEQRVFSYLWRIRHATTLLIMIQIIHMIVDVAFDVYVVQRTITRDKSQQSGMLTLY